MSIKPRWSELIVSGAKTIELRRQPSGCRPGTPLVIYTSHPVKRVEAVATVAAVHALPPAVLAARCATRAKVTDTELLAYAGDLDVAYGIELTDVRALPAPFELDRPGPQSWRYLFADEPEGSAVIAAASLDRAADSRP